MPDRTSLGWASVREVTRGRPHGEATRRRHHICGASFGGQTLALRPLKAEAALLAKSLFEPRVVAYRRKVVVSARVFPEPR
jgi:hypothetical protein